MPYHWYAMALETLAGIEPHEVTQALAATRRLPYPVTVAGTRLVNIIAPTSTGRLLTITIRHHDGRDWWILGARDATDQQRAQYKQWEDQQ